VVNKEKKYVSKEREREVWREREKRRS